MYKIIADLGNGAFRYSKTNTYTGGPHAGQTWESTGVIYAGPEKAPKSTGNEVHLGFETIEIDGKTYYQKLVNWFN